MFELSTQACDYTNEENLMRLQQALKGRAPEIIECLKMAFGQPCVILETQIEKISRLPPVKADRIESVVPFSTAVMKASGLESQYDNPMLLKELLKKLGNDMKMRWATYALDNDVSGVVAFGTWLKLEAKKVYTVLLSLDVDGKKKEVPGVRSERPFRKSSQCTCSNPKWVM